MMKGKHAVMEMLLAEGVKHIFGNPGTSESPVLDALESYPSISYVLATQEGPAMGMADAYARSTGAPSFVNLHIETGLANGISLLNNAHAGGTPLVLSSGNKDIRKLAEGRTDLAEMVRLFTKWTAEITHPGQVPGVMRRAFNEAKTPPTGPTYVGFAANAMDGEADVDIVPSPRGYFRTAPDVGAVQDAARLLAEASRPLILVGDRLAQSGGAAEAVRVAELLGAPVYSASYSEMSFPTGHSYYLGPISPDHPAGREILASSDAVLAVGNVFTGYFFFPQEPEHAVRPGTRLVHVDSSPREVGKTQPTDVGITADPKTALAALGDALEDAMSGSAREAAKMRGVAVAEQKAAQRAAWQDRLRSRWDMRPMSSERMMTELAGALPADTLVVDDSITTRRSVFGAMEFSEPGGIFGERGGAIGWGMGATLGAKLANPDRPVVGIIGDGSAMMTVQALWTAANENIPVVYVICNNGSYRILKLNMNVYKEHVLGERSPASKYIAMDFPTPFDLAGIAEAFGVRGRTIEDPTQLGPATREALDLGGPALLDVVIDGSV